MVTMLSYNIYIYRIRKTVLTSQRPHYPSSSGYITVVYHHWSITMTSPQLHGSSNGDAFNNTHLKLYENHFNFIPYSSKIIL